jgi:hypothetical protein
LASDTSSESLGIVQGCWGAPVEAVIEPAVVFYGIENIPNPIFKRFFADKKNTFLIFVVSQVTAEKRGLRIGGPSEVG